MEEEQTKGRPSRPWRDSDDLETEGRWKTAFGLEEGRIKDRGTRERQREDGRPLRPEHHAVQGFAGTIVTPLA
jgi:hypothetical protein